MQTALKIGLRYPPLLILLNFVIILSLDNGIFCVYFENLEIGKAEKLEGDFGDLEFWIVKIL